MKVLLNLISSSLSHSLSYSLSSSVAHLGNYLVLIIICIILVAAIIILGITFFTNYAVKNAVKKKTPPPPKSTIVKEKIVPLYRLPLWGGRLSQFLTLKGFFRVGDIGLSFLRALAFLRERLDNLTYKYQLPWYFMVGAGNSGKSTLLEHAGMSLPVGMPNLGIDDAHPPCRWWFYNRAVILDIQGSLVIGEHKTTSEERAWRSILSLLARYRSKRPLDGIILTISATELYGHEKLSPENLNARAKFLGQKLITAQHFLGIRLPVYVVVTKCDVLPGFQSFCHELPVAHRNNILGWSVPYALHTAFTSQWIDEAFQTIHENLSSVRLEMFVQGTAPENADGIFILDQEFSLLKGGLKLYLDHIFKNSAYEASLMLRGIYFCGDSGIQHLPASINMSENLETQNEDSILKADLALSTYPRLVDIDAQRSMSENADFPDQEGQLSWEESQYLPTSHRAVFFGKDIFESKIFFESGLAYPIYSRLVSANRHINLAKVGIVAFLAIGTFGMLNAYEKFRKNYDFLMPVLGKVNSVLARIPRTPGETPMAEGLFDAQAKSLLDMMNHLQQTSFFSIFIPSSWFSPLHDQLNSSLKISYEQIVLRTIYMDLLLKARDVLNYRPDTRAREAKTTAFSILLLPTTTLEFQELKGYVDRVDLLCHNIEKYNALRNSADPSLLTDLVDYTFNMQLPAEFSASYQKFRKILQEAPYPPIDLKPYYPLAQNTLQGLYGRFLNVLFAPNDPQSFIGQLRYLTFAMGNSQTGQPVNLDLVRSLVTGIQQGLSQFGTIGKTWIDSPYFDPGPEFLEVIAKVNDNLAFGPVIVDQLARQTSAIYDAFHQEIMQINRLLVAPANVDPASVDLARPAAFSAGIFSIEQFLSKLFAQPFMTRSTNEMFVAQVPETKAVLWNQNLID
jgi:type VI secretion system protein ImpL